MLYKFVLTQGHRSGSGDVALDNKNTSRFRVEKKSKDFSLLL